MPPAAAAYFFVCLPAGGFPQTLRVLAQFRASVVEAMCWRDCPLACRCQRRWDVVIFYRTADISRPLGRADQQLFARRDGLAWICALHCAKRPRSAHRRRYYLRWKPRRVLRRSGCGRTLGETTAASCSICLSPPVPQGRTARKPQRVRPPRLELNSRSRDRLRSIIDEYEVALEEGNPPTRS